MKRLWTRRGGDLRGRLHARRRRPAGLPRPASVRTRRSRWAPRAWAPRAGPRGSWTPCSSALRSAGPTSARLVGVYREARGRRGPGRRHRDRLAQPDRRRQQGGRARRGARLPRANVRDVPELGDAGADDGAASSSASTTSLDDWTINGTPAQCRETIARGPRLGPRRHRPHDLQPAARRARPHRLSPDDRRRDRAPALPR